MAISIMAKLERLLSKHFKVEKTDKAIKVYPKKSGRFSRRDWDKVTEIADRYGANVNGMGYIRVSKKRSCPGQNSILIRGKRRTRFL